MPNTNIRPGFLDELARLSRQLLGVESIVITTDLDGEVLSHAPCHGVEDCHHLFRSFWGSQRGTHQVGFDGPAERFTALDEGYLSGFQGAAPLLSPDGQVKGVICAFGFDASFHIEQLQALGVFGGSLLAECAHGGREVIPPDRLNEAIATAHQTFLKTESDFETFSLLLNDALHLTGAQEGMIGEFLFPPQADPRLVVKAATDMSWDEKSRQMYENIEHGGMVFENPKGLLGAPLRSERVVVENAFPESARRRMPKAHPTLRNYIGIPLFSGRDVIGLLALGNHPEGFSEELGAAMRPLANSIGALIGLNRLTAERRSFGRQLHEAAYYDPLTGLPNRRLFDQRFEERLEQADQSNETIAICLLDLDGFKAINDRHGHEMGDHVLKEIANRLAAMVEPTEVLARLSGDEFAFIFRHDPSSERYQRLLDSLSANIMVADFHLGLSASIGVTLYPDDRTDKERLLRHADQAMYVAKESGKNRVAFFDLALEEFRQTRQEMIAEFREALKKSHLELYFQPRVLLASKAVIGFEALIRWNLKGGRLRPPNEFLPYLVDSAAEIELGQFVLREAVEALRVLQAKFGPDISVNVNLTASHYLSDHFEDDLVWLSELPADIRQRLVFEVLESSIFDSLEKAQQILRRCRSLGFQVALDDFGTGYSSLSYLRSLPCDELKIDRAFVSRMLDHEEDRYLIEGMIHLGHALQKSVTVEGIETEDQVQALESMGDLTAQGFLFGHPVPLHEVIR